MEKDLPAIPQEAIKYDKGVFFLSNSGGIPQRNDSKDPTPTKQVTGSALNSRTTFGNLSQPVPPPRTVRKSNMVPPHSSNPRLNDNYSATSSPSLQPTNVTASLPSSPYHSHGDANSSWYKAGQNLPPTTLEYLQNFYRLEQPYNSGREAVKYAKSINDPQMHGIARMEQPRVSLTPPLASEQDNLHLSRSPMTNDVDDIPLASLGYVCQSRPSLQSKVSRTSRYARDSGKVIAQKSQPPEAPLINTAIKSNVGGLMSPAVPDKDYIGSRGSFSAMPQLDLVPSSELSLSESISQELEQWYPPVVRRPTRIESKGYVTPERTPASSVQRTDEELSNSLEQRLRETTQMENSVSSFSNQTDSKRQNSDQTEVTLAELSGKENRGDLNSKISAMAKMMKSELDEKKSNLVYSMVNWRAKKSNKTVESTDKAGVSPRKSSRMNKIGWTDYIVLLSIDSETSAADEDGPKLRQGNTASAYATPQSQIMLLTDSEEVELISEYSQESSESVYNLVREMLVSLINHTDIACSMSQEQCRSELEKLLHFDDTSVAVAVYSAALESLMDSDNVSTSANLASALTSQPKVKPFGLPNAQGARKPELTVQDILHFDGTANSMEAASLEEIGDPKDKPMLSIAHELHSQLVSGEGSFGLSKVVQDSPSKHVAIAAADVVERQLKCTKDLVEIEMLKFASDVQTRAFEFIDLVERELLATTASPLECEMLTVAQNIEEFTPRLSTQRMEVALSCIDPTPIEADLDQLTAFYNASERPSTVILERELAASISGQHCPLEELMAMLLHLVKVEHAMAVTMLMKRALGAPKSALVLDLEAAADAIDKSAGLAALADVIQTELKWDYSGDLVQAMTDSLLCIHIRALEGVLFVSEKNDTHCVHLVEDLSRETERLASAANSKSNASSSKVTVAAMRDAQSSEQSVCPTVQATAKKSYAKVAAGIVTGAKSDEFGLSKLKDSLNSLQDLSNRVTVELENETKNLDQSISFAKSRRASVATDSLESPSTLNSSAAMKTLASPSLKESLPEQPLPLVEGSESHPVDAEIERTTQEGNVTSTNEHFKTRSEEPLESLESLSVGDLKLNATSDAFCKLEAAISDKVEVEGLVLPAESLDDAELLMPEEVKESDESDRLENVEEPIAIASHLPTESTIVPDAKSEKECAKVTPDNAKMDQCSDSTTALCNLSSEGTFLPQSSAQTAGAALDPKIDNLESDAYFSTETNEPLAPGMVYSSKLNSNSNTSKPRSDSRDKLSRQYNGNSELRKGTPAEEAPQFKRPSSLVPAASVEDDRANNLKEISKRTSSIEVDALQRPKELSDESNLKMATNSRKGSGRATSGSDLGTRDSQVPQLAPYSSPRSSSISADQSPIPSLLAKVDTSSERLPNADVIVVKQSEREGSLNSVSSISAEEPIETRTLQKATAGDQPQRFNGPLLRGKEVAPVDPNGPMMSENCAGQTQLSGRPISIYSMSGYPGSPRLPAYQCVKRAEDEPLLQQLTANNSHLNFSSNRPQSMVAVLPSSQNNQEMYQQFLANAGTNSHHSIQSANWAAQVNAGQMGRVPASTASSFQAYNFDRAPVGYAYAVNNSQAPSPNINNGLVGSRPPQSSSSGFQPIYQPRLVSNTPMSPAMSASSSRSLRAYPANPSNNSLRRPRSIADITSIMQSRGMVHSPRLGGASSTEEVTTQRFNILSSGSMSSSGVLSNTGSSAALNSQSSFLNPSLSIFGGRNSMSLSGGSNNTETIKRPTFCKITESRMLPVGVTSNVETLRNTMEQYRQNAKKTDEPNVQFDFGRFMIEAAYDVDDKQIQAELLDEGYRYMKKLAHSGHADAAYYMAKAFLDDGDCDRAFPYLELAAKHGNVRGTLSLAQAYELGLGTKRDKSRAMQFYKKAASLDEPIAMTRIGRAFADGDLGLKRNTREAMKWYKRAMVYNHPETFFEAAKLYQVGAKPYIHKDVPYAVSLYTEAAELGFAEAQLLLGTAYEYGQLGLQSDATEAIKWYSRAAESGNAEAQCALAGWYLTGAQNVLEQSDDLAFYWITKSAAQGLPKAEFALGYFMEEGIGSPRNADAALHWYELAATHGDRRAVAKLEGTLGSLPRNEIARKKSQLFHGGSGKDGDMGKEACRIM